MRGINNRNQPQPQPPPGIAGDTRVVQAVTPLLKTFSANVFHVGTVVGTAHAGRFAVCVSVAQHLKPLSSFGPVLNLPFFLSLPHPPVKAINNTLNVSQLLLCAEGLAALSKMGADPKNALDFINRSSGRSLISMERMPKEVLSRDFAYGFKLGLMRKVRPRRGQAGGGRGG